MAQSTVLPKESEHLSFLAQAVRQQRFKIRPLTGALEAEIIGLDWGQPLAESDFLRIRQAHLQHYVLVFREQRITSQRHIDFGRLMIHAPHPFHPSGHPEILIVSNVLENDKPIGLGNAGKYWHSDISISYKELPSPGSFLHVQELPAEGGDTLCANVYKTLPEDLKQAIERKQVVHRYLAKCGQLQKEGNWRPTLRAEQFVQVQEVAHPVVRFHPETRPKALFISAGFTTRIEGLLAEARQHILKVLFAHSIRPEHTYRYQSQSSDLLFWDNRAPIHLATGCLSQLRRRLYRTTIEGDAPF